MAFDPGRPFNALPDLPPASDTETRAVLRSYLKALAAEGVLEETKAGRENLYINSPLLALLADRA